jgi:hypothetical protein
MFQADGAELMTVGGWDGAFNLTTSYRMDSDIPRPFGDYESELKYARFKLKNGNWTERQTPQEHLQVSNVEPQIDERLS